MYPQITGEGNGRTTTKEGHHVGDNRKIVETIAMEEDEESEKSEEEVSEGDNTVCSEDDTCSVQFDDASHDRIYRGRDISGNIKVK